MTNNLLTPIGITIGDPSGIGPEIVVSALNSPKINKNIIPIIYGNHNFLLKACSILNIDRKIIKSKSFYIRNWWFRVSSSYVPCICRYWHIGNC